MELKYGMPKNLMNWVEAHKDRLAPPVCNAALYPDGNYIINMVGGGNGRTDFHDNSTEEFFYQIEGEVEIVVLDRGKFDRIVLKAGDVFLQPPHLLHSPQRPKPGLCLLIEHPRPQGSKDALQWHCAHCATQIWRAEKQLESLVDDLPKIYQQFYALGDAERVCPNCGTQHPGKDYHVWLEQLKHSTARV